MKRSLLIMVATIANAILVFILIGCGYGPKAQSIPPTSQPTALANRVAPSIPCNARSGLADVVPPYKDIQETIEHILVGSADLSKGVSNEQKQKLKQYSESLKGKKVENWCGWVGDVTPNEEVYSSIYNPVYPYPFSVWILMSRSSFHEGKPPFTEVVLGDVPNEEVDKLYVWHDWTRGLDANLQKVMFSGIVTDVDVGLVLIGNATVLPLDQK
jgi:hypothetical protein